MTLDDPKRAQHLPCDTFLFSSYASSFLLFVMESKEIMKKKLYIFGSEAGIENKICLITEKMHSYGVVNGDLYVLLQNYYHFRLVNRVSKKKKKKDKDCRAP